MKCLPTFFLLGLLGGGCVSAPTVPDWARKNWQEKQVYYFSGISSDCRNVACAKEEAYNNAVANIATYLGSTVSVLTESELDNSGQYLSAHFKSATREVPLKHIKVEKFKVSRYEKHLTGYLLVSVEKSELSTALAQIEWDQVSQERQLQNRRNIGAITIHTPKYWKDLEGQLSRFLNKAGYLIGKNGKNLFLQVDDFTCTQSHIQDIQICTLQAKVKFQQQEHIYISKGYGRTQEQARKDMVNAWIGQIPENILEDK